MTEPTPLFEQTQAALGPSTATSTPVDSTEPGTSRTAAPADQPPTFRTPSPDAGHEAIRGPLEQAIDDLAQTVADLAATTASADLLQMIVGFFQNNIDALLTDLADLHDQVNTLTAALPPPEPAQAGTPTDGS